MLLALMGYALPVAALIPVHGAVQFFSNAGRMHVQRAFLVPAMILPFLAGAAVGAAVGAQFVGRIEDPLLKAALGVFILAVTWMKFPALAKGGPAIFAAGGAFTTFLTMFFGATGPLVAVFFEKSFTDRRAYSANHAAAMSVQHAFKIAAFVLAGFAFADWLLLILAMAATGYLGTRAGARLLNSLPEARFRIAFRWLLTLLALDLVRRGLFSYWP